jgi:thiamine biosynthesis lipoprotein
MNLTGPRLALLFFLSLCLSHTGCTKPLPAESEFVLGTVCTVNLYQGGTKETYRKIFDRLREIEDLMSANKADTEVDILNREAGILPVKVSAELIEAASRARYYAELSGGAFDPTIGPLVKLWGIGGDEARLPGEEEIRLALPLIDWRDLVIDRERGSLFLRRSGQALDLGAIAKGYAADEAVRILAQARIPGGLVDLGGNIVVYGEKEGKAPWRIGIQDPLESRGAYLGVLEVRNKSVVTSGVYERFLELEGKRYHHILSAKTGYPVENGLLSVTVIADHSVDADALATAAFALGYEPGKALVEAAGAEGIFVFEDKSIRGSAGVLGQFTLSAPEYRIDG